MPAFALFMALFVTYLANVQPFPYRVASKCKGEASFATLACYCTVANRLAAGASQAHVLDAYYARNVTPSASDVVSATNILAQGIKCEPKGAWFLYSKQDHDYLRITQAPIAHYVRTSVYQIFVYEREYKTRKE
jgi:hypothetical protein